MHPTNDVHTLISAAIQHLEREQARGNRFVSLDPDVWANFSGFLSGQVTPPVPAARPRIDASSVAPAPASDRSALKIERPGPAAKQEPPPPPAVRQRNENSERKASAIAALRERVLPCRKCPHLARERKQVVFGVGDPNASLMFVGEAPGAEEDAQGEPFVGKAGQLLTKIIQTMGLSRESVYIANILKCRPDTPGQAYGNRKPRAEEMDTCMPYLLEQIEIIQPRVLVALGRTAVEGLLKTTSSMSQLRGHWQEFRGVPLMPTFHPSYVLRNQSLQTKRRVWEDMLEVMRKLELPISDKQRGFFLPR